MSRSRRTCHEDVNMERPSMRQGAYFLKFSSLAHVTSDERAKAEPSRQIRPAKRQLKPISWEATFFDNILVDGPFVRAPRAEPAPEVEAVVEDHCLVNAPPRSKHSVDDQDEVGLG